jgi:hypothetical protein
MIGSLMMRVSVVVLLAGMLAGIAMGIRQDFTLQPAHAHLNLVGGVLLFLFGMYYRLFPAAADDKLAKLQGCCILSVASCFRRASPWSCLKVRPSSRCRSWDRWWWSWQPRCSR